MARKRKDGLREPNGRLKRSTRDRGPPEIQRRRDRLFRDGDITCPLDIMLANGVIQIGEYEACNRYGFLHYVVYGRANLAAASYDGERPAGARRNWPDEFIQNRRSDYETARHNLKPQVLEMLDNLIIFGRAPRWIAPLPPRSKDFGRSKTLLAAIRLLAERMGYAAALDK